MYIKIGDRITFKSPTRDGNRKMTRVVNGFWSTGDPTVRAHGWAHFVVHFHEISAINGEEID